ncbi:MAG: (d)CMP kinase [Verrucomicrobia bacterium]|nr:(d)CMP kinase [Verrucomicrobiota bacterium]
MNPDDVPEFSVIAIDGPAASGKSTVARKLAKRLGFSYVNSGALYRGIAWLTSEHHIRPTDAGAVCGQMRKSVFSFDLKGKEMVFSVNGVNPEPHLRDEEVNRTVSAISAIAEVREFLVAHLRTFLTKDDLVMEGRDIGSIVFPDTPYKFYIDASLEVRAQRRAIQGQRDDLFFRDRADSSRRSSPLTIAEDAHVIDSSTLTIDGVVGEIVGRLKMQGLGEALRLD